MTSAIKYSELPADFPLQCLQLLQMPFIQLSAQEGMYNLQLSNILYCSSENSLTLFHTTIYAKPVIVSKSLRHFETLLRDYAFERVHNKRLVNLAHIQRCHQGNDGYELELTGGEKIGVSRAMKKNLTRALKRISVGEQAGDEPQKRVKQVANQLKKNTIQPL